MSWTCVGVWVCVGVLYVGPPATAVCVLYLCFDDGMVWWRVVYEGMCGFEGGEREREREREEKENCEAMHLRLRW